METDAPDREHLVDGKYGIADLVDIPRLAELFERFTLATGWTIGLLDHPGLNILVASGWRDICTRFHRGCEGTAAVCLESNRRLLDRLDQPGQTVIEACDNGLVDCATPIIVKGKHIASLATGQLLLERPDVESFRRRARQFGFEEEAYLRALGEVPTVTEENVKAVTGFLGEMAHMISQLGYARLVVQEEAERLEREIDDRRQAEVALRASEERHRALLDAIPDLIFRMDREGRLLDWKSSAGLRPYVSPEQFIGRNQAEVLPPDVAQQARGAIDRALATGVTQSIEYRLEVEGRLLDYEARVVKVNDREVMAIVADITERRRIEAERERLQAQLLQAQKMDSVGRLAGGVAHDFNNKLTVILGHAELARTKRTSDPSIGADLEEIQQAARLSAELTSQLLAFARRQTTAPRVLDLNATVTGMLRMLRRLISENIVLDWKPGEGLGPVRVDPAQVDQLLANLVVNARDAIADLGRITIVTGNVTLSAAECAGRPDRVPGEYVALTVTDTGCGMGPDTLEHLYEPFFTTKEVGRGTGLGLATVFGIVQQNQGFIEARSEPGRGTEFRIGLPRYAGADQAVSPEAPGEPPRGRGETVLLVDDEQPILNIGRRLLEMLGYAVLTAGTPGEALRLVRDSAGPLHLLVTDLVMPEMTGRELAGRAVGIRPDLKCLFMSGYSAESAGPAGATDESSSPIQKPFTLAGLAARVRRALDSGPATR